jgi:hypothetical protein
MTEVRVNILLDKYVPCTNELRSTRTKRYTKHPGYGYEAPSNAETNEGLVKREGKEKKLSARDFGQPSATAS